MITAPFPNRSENFLAWIIIVMAVIDGLGQNRNILVTEYPAIIYLFVIHIEQPDVKSYYSREACLVALVAHTSKNPNGAVPIA
jgi:hypothetical protein